jgi:hypothetical protein
MDRAMMEKLENERIRNFARLTAASHKFCMNELVPRLKKIALNSCGDIASVSNTFVVMRDGYNNEVLRPVITAENGNRYVDGSVGYSQKVIERYLSKSGFVVEWIDDVFLKYGWDYVPTKTLTVSVK